MKLHPDWADFIGILNRNGVEYMVVGAFAVGHWGSPRATKDLDVWIRPETANATRLMAALREFGFRSMDVTEEDVLSGKVMMLGVVPFRIDILTVLDGLTAEEAWASRQPARLETHDAFVIGREALIRNKKAAGRHQDLFDVQALGG